jgi:hypothetical protein
MLSISRRHSAPSSHGGGRIVRHHLADHQPVEQHAHGGELLLDARRRVGLLQRLDVGANVVRPDHSQRQPAAVAPSQEARAGPRIGPSRVRVADVGGKEFNVAPARLLAGVGDQRRHHMGVRQGGERAGLDGGGDLVGHESADFRLSTIRRRWLASMMISAASSGSSSATVRCE